MCAATATPSGWTPDAGVSAQVQLRGATPQDSPRILEWRNQPEVARWMYSDHQITPEEHARFMASALIDPARRYWVVELDGRPVGLANLADLSPAHRRCAWAYYLADPAVRGRGVGAFVEVFVLDHVFRELGLHKLTCEVLLENEAVWTLHESFGFQREGLFRAHIWKSGRPHDVVAMAMLAPDWEAARPAAVARLRARGFNLDD